MFKNLIALRITNPVTQTMLMSDEFVEMVQCNPSEPPSPGAWRKLGFSQPDAFGYSPVADVAKGVRVFCVRMQERILPGAVINRKLVERVANLAKMENRSLNRREVAQLKDAVISELLPNSHIRDKDTLMAVVPGWLLVDTGSAKVMEDAVSWLREMITTFDEFPDSWQSLQVTLMDSRKAAQFLRELGTDNFAGTQFNDFDDTPTGPYFKSLNSVTVKGDGIIRLKDIDHDSPEFQSVFENSRIVVDMGVSWGRSHDTAELHCTINDHLIVRKLAFSDIVINQINADEYEDAVSYFHGTMIIVANLLLRFVEELRRVTAVEESTEEDDEL